MIPKIGISDSKLAQATATPSTVVPGKTFYAGDSTLKVGSLKINQLKTYPTDNGGNPLWTFYHYSGLNDKEPINVEVLDVFYRDAIGGISIYDIITFSHSNPYFILTARKELLGYEVHDPTKIQRYNPGDQIAYVQDSTLNEYVLWEPIE